MEVFEVKRSRIRRQASTGPPTRYSKMPYLLTMAGVVFITCIVLVVMHFTLSYKSFSEGTIFLQESKTGSLKNFECSEKFCNSKDCISIASRLAGLMNPSADPCSDFYEYACGGYVKVKAIPHGHSSYSAAKEAQTKVLLNIRKLMERPSDEGESRVLKETKIFYNSCINTTSRDKQEKRALEIWFSDIETSLDSILNDEDEIIPGRWKILLARLEEYQIHTIFKPSFKTSENLPIERIEVDCEVPFLNPDAYLNISDSKHVYELWLYKELMDSALNLLSVDKYKRQEFIEEILQIETELATVIRGSSPEDYPDLSEENVRQLKELWRPVIGDGIEDVQIVSSCKYNLNSIMAVLNNAPPKRATRYVTWRMLMQLMQYLGSGFRNLHVNYLTKFPNLDYAYISGWQECSDVVRKELGLPVLKALFDRNYLKLEHVAEVKEDFLDIKREFLHAFSSIKWLDSFTSEKFLDKLKNMKFITGFEDIANQAGVLDTIYKDLEFEDNYFLNVINLKRFKTRYFFTRLWYQNPDQPISEISLQESPLGGCSIYDYVTNTVRFDIDLQLQPLFYYSKDSSKFLKYGQLSPLAGEISHSFDATGVFYDGDGNRREKFWWPHALEQKYDSLIECISNQTFQMGSKTFEVGNSTDVLNTIIADIGSFLIPYEGLTAHLKNKKREKPLPGLTLTKKQTYFVQVAQRHCELTAKQPSESDALPQRLRVNKAVSNLEDFGKVFSCPTGSPMNPENKCTLLR